VARIPTTWKFFILDKCLFIDSNKGCIQVVRTALLTNFVPPYRLELLRELENRVDGLKIFVSTRMEDDRPWSVDNGELDVVFQKTLTINAVRRHPSGFTQRLHIHFPYDTLPRLWRYAPRVVITSELGLRTLQAAIYRRFTPRSRLIVWATLSEQTERGWGIGRRLIRRAILKIADAVLCNGLSGAKYIAGLGFPAERTVIVNQPIDVRRFVWLPVTRDGLTARRLIFSGRLIPLKGVIEMQAALARWARSNPSNHLDLLWVGDGELRGQLENTMLPSNFTQSFCGNQPYDALPDIYAGRGVLILPSLIDEWGLVVNEAMVGGLIVIGSIYSQAAIEMVRDGCTGWLIDPLCPGSIERAMDELFRTPLDELDNMRIAGRERGLMITPENAADHILSAIRLVSGESADMRSEVAIQETRLERT
jgi:glycosyltransferase involved in cell wall biosynthesis